MKRLTKFFKTILTSVKKLLKKPVKGSKKTLSMPFYTSDKIYQEALNLFTTTTPIITPFATALDAFKKTLENYKEKEEEETKRTLAFFRRYNDIELYHLVRQYCEPLIYSNVYLVFESLIIDCRKGPDGKYLKDKRTVRENLERSMCSYIMVREGKILHK